MGQKGVGIKTHNSGNQVGIGLLVVGQGGRGEGLRLLSIASNT